MMVAVLLHFDFSLAKKYQLLLQFFFHFDKLIIVFNFFLFQLSDVSLIENDRQSRNSNDFKQRLEAKPLRFAFQDGVIENVCSTTGEDERVLNIKRAVLSTFQNSMKQLDKDGLFTEVNTF